MQPICARIATLSKRSSRVVSDRGYRGAMVDSSLHADAERLLVHELLRTWRELNRTHFENTLRPPVLAMVDTRGSLGRWVPDGRIPMDA